VNPYLLHIVLLGCALPCVFCTLGEMRKLPLSPARLAVPPLLAIICAVLLLAVGNGPPPWTFGIALASGLAVGAVRGFTLQLQFDPMFARVHLPWARGSFLVAVGLVGAVVIGIGGAVTVAAGMPFLAMAADIAAACAGILTGRLIVIAIRWRGARPRLSTRASGGEIQLPLKG
jgi:hypothetical protein